MDCPQVVRPPRLSDHRQSVSEQTERRHTRGNLQKSEAKTKPRAAHTPPRTVPMPLGWVRLLDRPTKGHGSAADHPSSGSYSARPVPTNSPDTIQVGPVPFLTSH